MIKYLPFYEPTEEYGWGSNFYKTKPLKIDNETWNTTEQYFQAMKFRGPKATQTSIDYSNIIREADSPMKVKMLGTQRKNLRFGKKWVLNKKTDPRIVNDLIDEYKDKVSLRPDWDTAKIPVMIKALYYKFKNPQLNHKLISIPDNALLVEHTTRDKVWGDGGDGGTGEKGSNYLGKILTSLSHYFKYGTCDKMPDILKKAVKIVNRQKKKVAKKFKILSWNVNGIRSNIVSTKKYNTCGITNIEYESNLGDLINKHNPDIICLQETRCDEKISGCINLSDYHQYWNCSKGVGARAGARYSGVTLWSKTKPNKVSYSFPNLNDNEGRAIIAEYDNFVLITTYVPNAGTNFDYRVNVWDKAVRKYLYKLNKTGKNVIWCGDLNVARTPNDVFWGDPSSSSYNKSALQGVGASAKAGYTKEERDNFERLLKKGYVDVYRHFYPNEKGAYTWWNPRIPVFRESNKGWRIDYFIVNNKFLPCVTDMNILPNAGLLSIPQGSDHAAILLDIKIDCVNESSSGSSHTKRCD